MATVTYSERAADWLEDAEPDVAERIVAKLDEASGFPSHFLKPLAGQPYHRLRVGDHRVIVDWRRDDDELFVRRIGHRRNIYD